MTQKEAVLKSLEDINDLANAQTVLENILDKMYYDFGNAKTPVNTISSTLGYFIRNSDSRVKRISRPGGTYSYYLAKNEANMSLDVLNGSDIPTISQKEPPKTYHERALHKILSSFLKNNGVYSKTIFHEQSTFRDDKDQVWTHPDMVGIRFFNLKSKTSQNFFKAINRVDTFELSSYEVKKEINSDSELKRAFFQAVSNSSWANHGYLAAFEFRDTLMEEMERLNESFGIGIIKLSANPYESKFLFQAKHRDLDFRTIDKLCIMNKDFDQFIEQTEKLMSAEERYYKSTQKELEDFCDKCFSSDSEFENYCSEHRIPFEKNVE